jgi:DNA-binding HxlR family transcriptional regulator
LAFNALRKRRAVEIALSLFGGPKCVREIRDAIEGSFTTIGMRIEELVEANIIEEAHAEGIQYYKKPFPKRVMRLTDEGQRLVDSLIQSGFLSVLPLKKTRQKWILLVLKALGGVKGRTRLVKLLFLLKFEFDLKREISFRFRPWIYGPYSKDIIGDLRDLQIDDLICERSVPHRRNEFREEKLRYAYNLTSRGAKLAQEYGEKVPYDIMEKIGRLKPFNEMTLDKLLEFVYYNHQDFITSSTIVERVLDFF